MEVRTAQQRDPLTASVIGAAIEVHENLGPGLLESVYETCLAYELAEAGRRVVRQRSLPVQYKSIEIGVGLRIDLLVDDTLIVEVNAVEQLTPLHEAQLLTYMRLARIRTGLLLNFNVRMMKDGIVRRVL